VSRLRASLRLVSFLLWSACLFVTYQLSRPLGWLWSQRHYRVQTFLCGLWARGVATIIGLRISVTGNAPRAPFILVSNHLGYVDIITLMSQTPGVFVSRADVAGWPVLGVLARAANTIFIDRSLRRDVARVNTLIRDVLASGRGLLMFPEGTSSGGDTVLPFRSSLLEPAVQNKQAVSFASLSYSTPAGAAPASEAVCWWGEMTFLDHFMGLLGLTSVNATVHFGEEPLTAATRHELAARLHESITSLRQTQPSTTLL
jgi:1-acyl-sn-glycerol-3-phosphate acyltransferase